MILRKIKINFSNPKLDTKIRKKSYKRFIQTAKVIALKPTAGKSNLAIGNSPTINQLFNQVTQHPIQIRHISFLIMRSPEVHI